MMELNTGKMLFLKTIKLKQKFIEFLQVEIFLKQMSNYYLVRYQHIKRLINKHLNIGIQNLKIYQIILMNI